MTHEIRTGPIGRVDPLDRLAAWLADPTEVSPPTTGDLDSIRCELRRARETLRRARRELA